MTRRRASRAHRVEAARSDAERLLNDPAFQRILDTYEGYLITAIKNHKGGSPELDDKERELCRALRNLGGLKRSMIESLAAGHIVLEQQPKEADT